MSEQKPPGQDVAKPKPPSHMTQLHTGLQAMASELKTALPANITPEKFISTAITGIRTSKSQKQLLTADRRSLYNAVQVACSYGLMLDGREAALVPFGDQVQFMPMVQGLVKLARNSGLISTIIAEVVYSKDPFSYRVGIDASPVHEPDWFADDRGDPVGVWALVTLTNGDKIHAILPKKRVMQIASKSANKAQYAVDSIHFTEWWKKTAIKNVLKYAPKATELEKLDRLAHYDDERQGVDTETGEIIEAGANEATGEKPVRKGTRAAAKVKAAAGGDAGQQSTAPADTGGALDAEYEEVHGDGGDAGGQEAEEDEIPI